MIEYSLFVYLGDIFLVLVVCPFMHIWLPVDACWLLVLHPFDCFSMFNLVLQITGFDGLLILLIVLLMLFGE